MSTICFYCEKPVDPESRDIMRRMAGWERKSFKTTARRGGSDILMREPTGEVAHETCVNLMRRGVDPKQGALI